MAPIVLPSKIQTPPGQRTTLPRPRLHARLAEALARRLTLVCADAGFGKTTVLAQFAAASSSSVVWYRLDATDSDPATFAAYLLEALHPHMPRGPYRAARQSLRLVGDWTAGAQVLAAALHRVQRDLVIVLDDFHLLDSPSLSDGVARLVEALPPRARLVILARVLPELPLPRWRAEGALAEIGADDLRFSLSELRDLLIGLHGIPLTEASLRLVAARTEGWPAGVTLALEAVLARGAQAAVQALATLSGSSREIYDYLAQEAFARQTPEVQRFLLATALLSRFSTEFANALLDTTTARAVLDHLERSHLFLVPLDRERIWYRYHHLFHEFLQRLAAERDPQRVQVIHRRAAALWIGLRESAEAVHHFLEAGQTGEAAALLSETGLEFLRSGRYETVQRWLAAIPEQEWPGFPRLYLVRAWCEVAAGQSGAATRSLADALRRLRASGDHVGEADATRVLAHISGWDADLIRLLEEAVADLAPRVRRFPPSARGAMLEAVGRGAEIRGKWTVAERYYRRASAAAEAGGDSNGQLNTIRYLGLLLGTTGRFREAEGLLAEALDGYARRGWAHEEAHLHVELAAMLSSTGRHDDADRHLAHATALEATVPCRVLRGNLVVARAQASSRRMIPGTAGILRDALRAGTLRYLRDRFEASLELARADPEDAEGASAAALEMGSRLGPLHHARGVLASGLATRSPGRCTDAAARFRRLRLRHWEAVAVVEAAGLAKRDSSLRAPALRALRSLPEEMWPFLVTQTGESALAPYRDDPPVGARLRRLLDTLKRRPPAKVSVRCFGPFEVLRNGVPIDVWPRSAPRRLLQYLAVQARPVQRDEIVEALWPDLEPRHAANQLRVALSHLRRVLEPDLPSRQPSSLLATAGSTIALVRERLDVDLDRSRRAMSLAESSSGDARLAALTEMVECYRDDLLADSPYEEWAAPLRERLAGQYLDALAALADHAETRVEWEAALARWSAIVAREPAAEHACRGIMRCHLALGRAADALRAFEECRAALADLDLVPSPDTLALRDRIHQPHALDRGGTRATRRSGGGATPT